MSIEDEMNLKLLVKRVEDMRKHHTYTPTHPVSTVDLIVEHWGGMWAETMVFPLGENGKPTNWHEEDSDRYPTFDEALKDHARYVEQYGGAVRVVNIVGNKVVKTKT